MKKVFLGGTCNNSTWREELIPLLKIDYFNPVVDDWNDEAYELELFEREHCDFCLYVISPEMLGVYSIAEAVDDSNKRPSKTVFCIKGDVLDFGKHQLKSLNSVGKMVENNGGYWATDFQDLVNYLNDKN